MQLSRRQLVQQIPVLAGVAGISGIALAQTPNIPIIAEASVKGVLQGKSFYIRQQAGTSSVYVSIPTASAVSLRIDFSSSIKSVARSFLNEMLAEGKIDAVLNNGSTKTAKGRIKIHTQNANEVTARAYIQSGPAPSKDIELPDVKIKKTEELDTSKAAWQLLIPVFAVLLALLMLYLICGSIVNWDEECWNSFKDLIDSLTKGLGNLSSGDNSTDVSINVAV